MAGTFPGAWQETCLITIKKAGGSENPYEFHAITETVDISEPDYPWESIPNTAGGRIPKQSPQEDGEITLELYPTHIGVADNGGLMQQFNGGTDDASQPLITDTSWAAGVSRQRPTFLVAILWTDDIANADAVSATSTADSVGIRFYAKLARIVSHKTSFTEGILKSTVNFKFPAMNPAGTTMPWAWASTNDGDTTPLPALTYTSETDL
jgi:hypothetical protein